jgi:hypothetical protein
LDAVAVVDPTPATILLDTAALNFTAGSNSNIRVVPKDSETIIQSVTLFNRSGGKQIYQQFNLTRDNDTLWSASLPAQQINERGLEYYLEVRHGGAVTTFPQNGSAEPEIGIVRVPSLRYTDATLSSKYQMISLPVQTGTQTLRDLFQDELGTYDNIRYRFFDWNNDSTVFLELSALDSPLPAGKALWLITRDAKVLNIENALSTLRAPIFNLPLKPGWNMIADPFAFTVSWDLINRSNIQGNALWYYTGDSWELDSALVPFRGYAVKAIADTVLYIPAQEILSTAVQKSSPSGEWHLQISAENGTYQDRCNYAGIRTMADKNWDIYDISEPPAVGTFVSLYFQPDSATGSDAHLAGDFREPGQEIYSYNLILNKNCAGPTLIRVQPYNLPDQLDWVVLSTHSKIRYPRESWSTDRLSESFRVVVGTGSALQPVLDAYREIPANFHLAQNFPNPFNPATSIIYQLPRPAMINIDIFDILGKKIRTLLPRTYQEAGYYQLYWDGKNDHQAAVASAVYILYLRTEKYQQAIKMILQR